MDESEFGQVSESDLVKSPKVLNSEFKVGTLKYEHLGLGICRVNDFLSNPDIFPPAIL